MKVILTQDVEKLGDRGDVLEVKAGFARNYLIPNNFAIIASKGNLRTLENEKKGREKKEKREIENAKKIADKLSKTSYTIKAKCGEEGKLFGSVTAQDIAEMISEQSSIQIDKKKIELEEPIKKIGSFKVNAKIAKGISARITIEVIAEE